MRTSTIYRWAAALLLVASLAGTATAALAAAQSSSVQADAVLTFTPLADAYVSKNQSSSNFGASSAQTRRQTACSSSV